MATYWQAVSAASTSATIASMYSTEQPVVDLFSARLKAGIANSSATQKRILEMATTDADKAAMDVIAEHRKAVLGLVKKGTAMKQTDQAGVKAFLDTGSCPPSRSTTAPCSPSWSCSASSVTTSRRPPRPPSPAW